MTYTILPTTQPGVNIRQDYSPTHNYTVAASQTDCWPMRLTPDWQQVVITANQNSFWSQQQATLLAWLSVNPNGINVMPPQMGVVNVRLNGLGINWCFYAIGLSPNLIKPADLRMTIDPNQLGDGDIPAYWFNLQNLDNTQNAYYLQFHYYNQYGDLIQ